MRRLSRLVTAATLLTVVAGPPLLALAWLRRHPWHLPTRGQIDAWADRPMTAGTLLTACAGAAGLVWLLLIVYLARRAIDEIRRQVRRARRLPLPAPAQLTAGSMAGIAALTLPAAPPAHTHPVPAAADLPPPSRPAPSPATPPTAEGVALPGGGWIPYRTAAAIVAVAAGTWITRRRHYRPDPQNPRDHHDDTDLQPLPPDIDALTTVLNGHHPTVTGPPPEAVRGLPPGVLRLTGPGAAAAARGLLVIAAFEAATAGARTPIMIHPADLSAVLPDIDVADVAAVVPTAVPDDLRVGQPGGTDRRDRTVETGLDQTAKPVRGAVVVLGEHPAAEHVWHVDADGVVTCTTAEERSRLCTLDARTAVDLLGLLSRPPGAHPKPAADSGHPSRPAPRLGEAGTAHLALLGRCRLLSLGEEVHLRRTAGLQILAYLALHPDGATGADLIRALWPQLPATTISQRLHTTLTDLRRQLRPLIGGEPVHRLDDRYLLNAETVTTDLQHWHTLVDRMTYAADDTERRQACLDIIDAYRGEAAADRSWPWLTAPREQIRRTVIDAYATLAHHSDSTVEALQWLQKAIREDPYNEALHRRTVRLLQEAGDHAAARLLIKSFHNRIADRSAPL